MVRLAFKNLHMPNELIFGWIRVRKKLKIIWVPKILLRLFGGFFGEIDMKTFFLITLFYSFLVDVLSLIKLVDWLKIR